MEKIIFKTIVGSQMFGTNTPTSDKDIAEIYMCDNDDLLGFEYKEHSDINKDYRRYEVGKFIKLLMNGNPNMLEILNSPQDCVLTTSEEWFYIQRFKDMFVTKNIYNTMVNYAKSQLKKSHGLNKLVNWEKDKTIRKSVLDFCYIYPLTKNKNTQAITLNSFLLDKGYFHEFCGLVKIDHFKDQYLMYYEPSENFVGIIRDEITNDDVCLSNVNEKHSPIAILYFNKDGFSMHCKDYNNYQQWLINRSDERFNTNKKHGQGYDGKHISHIVRLLKTAREIGETNKIIVRRSKEEIEYLLKIKNGEVDLGELVKWAEIETDNLKEVFENNSFLPETVDQKFCNDLLIKIRKSELN